MTRDIGMVDSLIPSKLNLRKKHWKAITVDEQIWKNWRMEKLVKLKSKNKDLKICRETMPNFVNLAIDTLSFMLRTLGRLKVLSVALSIALVVRPSVGLYLLAVFDKMSVRGGKCCYIVLGSCESGLAPLLVSWMPTFPTVVPFSAYLQRAWLFRVCRPTVNF